MTPEQCFDAMAKVLGHSNPQDIGYIQLLEDVTKLKEEKKKLEEEMEDLCDEEGAKDTWDLVDKAELEKLEKENKKLEKEAKAWNIINHGADWENLRDLCDEDMCKALIETGECDKEDFEGYSYKPQ